MMEYEDIQIQLIDFPPWLEGRIEGNAIGALRRADGIIVVMDGKSERLLDEMESLLQDLEENKFELEKEKTLILVNKIETPLEQENFSIFKELYEEEFANSGNFFSYYLGRRKGKFKERYFSFSGNYTDI